MLRYFSIWLIALLVLSCGAPAFGGVTAGAASADSFIAGIFPATVAAAGLELIRSRAGEAFTECCVRFDSDLSKVWYNGHGDSRYTLTFRIVIPELDVDSSSIKFTLDAQGELVEAWPVDGVPDCLSLPEECEPAIHRTHALAIAKKEVIAGSAEDWEVEFLWRSDHGFVWEIVGQWPTNPDGGSSYYCAYMVIDARTGKIVEGRWSIKCVNRC